MVRELLVIKKKYIILTLNPSKLDSNLFMLNFEFQIVYDSKYSMCLLYNDIFVYYLTHKSCKNLILVNSSYKGLYGNFFTLLSQCVFTTPTCTVLDKCIIT